MSFYTDKKHLYCEKLRVKDVHKKIRHTPFYLYSLGQLKTNYRAYTRALAGRRSLVCYAVKANGNLHILKELSAMGAGAVLVSGNELRLAAAAGFEPKHTVFNGNGKTMEELELAIEHGTMVNIDSEFDLQHIETVARKAGKKVDVLLRINPDLDPAVHPYVSTGIRASKFGVGNDRVSWFLERVKSAPLLDLVGLHCHLGSTIQDVKIFRDATRLMMQFVETIRGEGIAVRCLNIGGGLGIDYSGEDEVPEQADLIEAIRDLLIDDITLIIEPGRSIVGNAGVLVTTVIGVKRNGDKHFIVVDGSMAELIRPSLYDAYHDIGFAEPVRGEIQRYDIVGPVCESADFLGKGRRLPTPEEGTCVVVHDTGAYGYAMASNYNARMRPAEYMVDGDRLIQIRRPERFDDLMQSFEPNPH